MLKTEHAGRGTTLWVRSHRRRGINTRVEMKDRAKSIRRHLDRQVVETELEAMCNCPSCRGGYEKQCWADVDCPEAERDRSADDEAMVYWEIERFGVPLLA